MKIIFKSLINSKSTKRYLLIFSLILAFLFTFLGVKNSFDKKIDDICNQEEYRMLIIEAKSDEILEEILNEDYIISYHEQDDEMVIVFDDYKNMDDFDDKYKDELTTYIDSRYPYLSLMETVSSSFNIVIMTVSVILVFIFTLCMLDIIKKSYYELALYKILGYKNKILHLIFLILMLIIFSFTYLMGYLMFVIIGFIFNLMDCYDLVISLIPDFNFIYVYLFGIIIVLILSIFLRLQIYCITPIKLIKKEK